MEQTLELRLASAADLEALVVLASAFRHYGRLSAPSQAGFRSAIARLSNVLQGLCCLVIQAYCSPAHVASSLTACQRHWMTPLCLCQATELDGLVCMGVALHVCMDNNNCLKAGPAGGPVRRLPPAPSPMAPVLPIIPAALAALCDQDHTAQQTYWG